MSRGLQIYWAAPPPPPPPPPPRSQSPPQSVLAAVHGPLLLVTVFGDDGCVLPLLLPQLVQNLLDISVAGGYSLELLLVHVADVATILLNRAVFGVKGL